MPTRYRVVGAICLFGGGLAVLLQYIVTPLSGGEMTGEEIVATVTEHHSAMGWALALDLFVLLAAPAFLYIGSIAGARTSTMASVGAAFLFFPFVVSLPAVFGFDALAFFAGTQPDPVAMGALVDSWQDSIWFAVSLFPYVLLQLVGSVLVSIALFRAKVVPSWVALLTAIWPFVAVAGMMSGVRVIGIVGYGLLFVSWTFFATFLLRSSRPVADDRTLVTA